VWACMRMSISAITAGSEPALHSPPSQKRVTRVPLLHQKARPRRSGLSWKQHRQLLFPALPANREQSEPLAMRMPAEPIHNLLFFFSRRSCLHLQDVFLSSLIVPASPMPFRCFSSTRRHRYCRVVGFRSESKSQREGKKGWRGG
jgi:hypothetical protein